MDRSFTLFLLVLHTSAALPCTLIFSAHEEGSERTTNRFDPNHFSNHSKPAWLLQYRHHHLISLVHEHVWLLTRLEPFLSKIFNITYCYFASIAKICRGVLHHYYYSYSSSSSSTTLRSPLHVSAALPCSVIVSTINKFCWDREIITCRYSSPSHLPAHTQAPPF